MPTNILFMLQDAAKATSKLFKALKQVQVKKNDINVLLATLELELLALEYGKIHFKAKESKVISKENYGEKIVNIFSLCKDCLLAIDITAQTSLFQNDLTIFNMLLKWIVQ